MNFLAVLLWVAHWNQGTPTQGQIGKPLPAIPEITWALPDNAYVKVTYEFVRQQDVKFSLGCENKCKGKKHFVHEQCDGSCDVRCTNVHGKVGADFFSLNRFGSNVEPMLNQFGIGGDIKGLAAAITYSIGKHADSTVGPLDKYEVDSGKGHWVKQPCSIEWKRFTDAQYNLIAHIQLFRDTVRPDGTTSTVTGPKLDLEAGELRIPIGEAVLETEIQCECSIVKKGTPRAEDREVGGVLVDPDTGDGNDEQQYCNEQMQSQYGLTCTVESMTSCTFSASNPTDKEIELCVYPGTELVCSDDKTQNVGTTSIVWLKIPPGKSGPFLPSTVSVKARVVCLNMNKREPDPSIKFKIGGSLPSVFVKLARFSNKERFKSVVEQIRFWIATDQARLAEVQKHLMFPKPSAGQYLRAIETVANVGEEDLTDPKYSECLDPSLIGGAPTTLEALTNFVQLMEKTNPKGLATAASDPKTYQILWLEEAQKYGDEHVAWCSELLATSLDPTVQAAAAKLLLEIVPSDRRQAVASFGGLSGVGYWLMGTDEDRAKKAIEILTAYRSKSSVVYLLNVNPALSEATRAKAKALADEISKAQQYLFSTSPTSIFK